MAGPGVGVLLLQKIDERARNIFAECLSEMSGMQSAEHFYVDGRPFVYQLGPEYPEELTEYAGLSLATGWEPADTITLAAMCNSDVDHTILGRVALKIARRLDGLIAFDAALDRYTEDRTILDSPHIFSYENESIITPQAFEAWLAHPDFRMVK